MVPVQLALFALALWCEPAIAQCYVDPFSGQRVCLRPPGDGAPPSAPVPSVDSSAHCRVTLAAGTAGSGVLVERRESVGLVLTCAHLFDDNCGRIVVSFPRAGQFAAKLIGIDRANDLAALLIRRPDAQPLIIHAGEPVGVLTACGYGPNNVFRAVRGAIAGRATAAGATSASTIIAGAVRPGDSGGAVLSAQGQLVGIVWGQRDGQTYATCGRPVQDFVRRIIEQELRQSPQANAIACRPPAHAQQPEGQVPPPSPAGPTPDFQTWASELDARLRAIDARKQDKGDYLRPGHLNAYLRADEATKLIAPLAPRTEVEAKLSTISSRFDSVHSVVDSVERKLATVATSRAGFLHGASLGKVAVGALGLSGPLAAAVVVATGLASWRFKKRVTTTTKPGTENDVAATRRPDATTRRSSLDDSSLSSPVAVDSPPPPQRAVPETHYVPIEKDSFAKAHQWASEHVARKYPGATEVLQAQDSLIKQFLAAK